MSVHGLGAGLVTAALLLAGCGDSNLGPSRIRSLTKIPVPPDLPLLTEQPWDEVAAGPWNYLLRDSGLDSDVIEDPTAPMSPPRVLRIAFTPDMPRDAEPGVLWTLLPNVSEVYAEWWIKLSANWTPSPAGATKMTFLWAAEGEGQVYTHIAGTPGDHVVQVNTEWMPYGQKFWEPNVNATRIRYGRWHLVSWHAKWSSGDVAADGLMRWWVDGVLNGDHRNVSFPRCCFEQFEFAPTRQLPPPTVDYMYVDHTTVRAR